MCQDGSAEFISASYKTPHKKAAHVKRMRRLYPKCLIYSNFAHQKRSTDYSSAKLELLRNFIIYKI